MTQLILEGDKVVGCIADKEYKGPVILATGHSARDVYRYLSEAKIEIESKGIAIGVRLEHPAQLIDKIQYHSKQGRGKYLPAAEYAMVTQVEGRGVYSFCMLCMRSRSRRMMRRLKLSVWPLSWRTV